MFTMIKKIRAARVARAAQIAKDKKMAEDMKLLQEENKKLQEKLEKTEKKLVATKKELAKTQLAHWKTTKQAKKVMKEMVGQMKPMMEAAETANQSMAAIAEHTKTVLEKESARTELMQRRVEELEAGAPAKEIKAHCTICYLDYSEEPDRIPRVLECGHTLCTFCIRMLNDDGDVQCPFDRQTTELEGGAEAVPPRNFAILEMLRPDYRS